ncbi:Dps family protein [Flectobacillus longus]|uniref:Dps family protein n=1 Tax=Flectobacillus longus TaxID=2984207 RepID=UPI0024B6413A|nr:DNA starvation/stationary phase protection protein [Flectobacillus longus]MDI9882348.1 DNA starvation/stationary phase protection protein [Flectobacillus longus]
METHISIKENDRLEIALELSKLLADEFVLYTKTRNAHWNVEGADFYTMHLFFEKQYDELDDIIDDVAERIRSIGHFAPATLKRYSQLTRLTEETREENTSLGLIKELLQDHLTIIFHLRENINRFATDLHDLGTSDFITGLMETHEKMAWMLRAHLK